MKLTPETVNLIVILITILLPALVLAVIQILRLTRWGRANKTNLDQAEEQVRYAQTILQHQARALETVVEAVERADAKAVTLPKPPTPAAAVRAVMTELEASAQPEEMNAWQNAVAKVRAKLAAEQRDAAPSKPRS